MKPDDPKQFWLLSGEQGIRLQPLSSVTSGDKKVTLYYFEVSDEATRVEIFNALHKEEEIE